MLLKFAGLISFFLTVNFLALPLAAQAATAQQGLQQAVTGTGLPTQSVESLAANLIISVLGIVGIIFLLLIIYAGYTWMVGGREGNEKEIAKAKAILSAATIGLIIVMAAYAITYFIAQQIEFATTGTVPQDPNPGDQGVPVDDGLPEA